jgi:predicted nucleic acid-binding Zn ribbon protein
MPRFEFVCKACGNSEVVEAESGSAAAVPECCDTPMKRVWNTAFHLLGEGWTRRPNDEIPTEDYPPTRPRR